MAGSGTSNSGSVPKSKRAIPFCIFYIFIGICEAGDGLVQSRIKASQYKTETNTGKSILKPYNHLD
jgi:hypothetical protein